MSELVAEKTALAQARPSAGPFATTPGTTMVWSADGHLVALCESAQLTPAENRANARHFALLSTLPSLLSRTDAALRAVGVQPRRASTRALEELAFEIRQAVVELGGQQ